jgi:SAM-dependent methyltransferase
MSPLSNSYLSAEQLHRMEPTYPLRVYVCRKCLLVQLEEFESPEHIFTDYAYFSSYSESWVRHAAAYVKMMAERFALSSRSRVVEIASNDGYLLQHFVARGVPVLGIEPAGNVAAVAVAKGVPTLVRFLNEETARDVVRDHGPANLVAGNNVLAHVPDLNGFTRSLRMLLAPDGVVTVEFPHVLRMIQENQFDTIYHEHFSYLSFSVVHALFASHDLVVFDVDEIPTHGGSLRVYARPAAGVPRDESPAVRELLDRERRLGFCSLTPYVSFTSKVQETKRALLEFLIDARRSGKTVVGYGAAAKGNTLLNYCGVRTDFVDYVVDRSPHKQGRFLPGTHIPILAPGRIAETRPDYVLILPWNLTKEVVGQLSYISGWGGRFVRPIPALEVLG